MFFEYGDDSVAQLGGVHLACEQASNILTKILEWGRLMSYLEQSTRYIAYDARLGGRYRFHRDPDVLASQFGTRYVGDMDRMFDAYSAAVNHGHQPRPRHDRPRSRRQRVRVPAGDAGQGARRHPRHAAGGEPVERRDLRHRPGVRVAAAADALAPAARGPTLRRSDAARAAQGHPELPAPRRHRRPRWRWSRVPRRHPGEHVGARRAAVRRRAGRPGAGGAARRLRPRRREQAAGGDLLQPLAPARVDPDRARPPTRRRREDRARAGLRGRPRRTAATSRVGRSSGSTTASTCCPTTAPSATCSGTACSRSSGRRSRRTTATPARSDRRVRRGPAVRRDDGPLGAPVRRPAPRASRSRPRTRWRWPTGCGT